MKNRLLGTQRNEALPMESFSERDNLLENTSRPTSNQVGAKVVGTVVKVRVSSFDVPELVQVVQVIFFFFYSLKAQKKFFIFLNVVLIFFPSFSVFGNRLTI
jgi:hypothetical protein